MSELSPVRQVFIHASLEFRAVSAFMQMAHFVNDNVFNARERLFSEFHVKPNPMVNDIASAPTGFHPLQLKCFDLHAHNGFPFADKGL